MNVPVSPGARSVYFTEAAIFRSYLSYRYLNLFKMC